MEAIIGRATLGHAIRCQEASIGGGHHRPVSLQTYYQVSGVEGLEDLEVLEASRAGSRWPRTSHLEAATSCWLPGQDRH